MKGNNDVIYEEETYATLKQRVNLNDDDNWLLGELSTPILFNQKPIDRVLVHTEDGLLTHTFRIVPQGASVKEGINQLLQYERVEWIMIE